MDNRIDIYTSLKEAAQELLRRREDVELEKKISGYLRGDIPAFINSNPSLVLFKHIITPNNESRRHLMMARDVGLDILGLEFTSDKFVSFNLDKYMLTRLFFYMGKKQDGRDIIYKKKIVDIHSAQGKPLSSLTTLWGESLIKFHHEILYKTFPEYKNKVYDLSEWISRNGQRSRFFYEKFMALLVRHCILVENFQFKGENVPHINGNRDESDFTHNVVLPAFEKIHQIFGLRPLVVQLAPDDYKTNPTWWVYDAGLKNEILDFITNRKTIIKIG